MDEFAHERNKPVSFKTLFLIYAARFASKSGLLTYSSNGPAKDKGGFKNITIKNVIEEKYMFYGRYWNSKT